MNQVTSLSDSVCSCMCVYVTGWVANKQTTSKKAAELQNEIESRMMMMSSSGKKVAQKMTIQFFNCNVIQPETKNHRNEQQVVKNKAITLNLFFKRFIFTSQLVSIQPHIILKLFKWSISIFSECLLFTLKCWDR